MTPASLDLTPRGILVCGNLEDPLARSFADSESAGLIALGGRPPEPGADPATVFWKSIADQFLRDLCHRPDDDVTFPPPDDATLAEWTLGAPPMRGGEYLSPDVLRALWTRLADWTRDQLDRDGGIAAFLQRHAPAWSRVGRVTVHLAENKKDPDCPFAFLATYASGLSTSGRLTQLPLGRALTEYGGAGNKPALLKLLTPLHRAAQASPLLAELIETGDVFHPLAWTPEEAFQFLRDVPAYEDAGLLVRLPNWWRKRGNHPKVTATIGEKDGPSLGLEALLDFQVHVTVDGQKLTRDEIEVLLAGDDGLVLLRGQWIEVDREKLQQALDHWKSIERGGELSFTEGMRLLAGAPADLKDDDSETDREWAFAQPGTALAETLARLTAPDLTPPPATLRATLRPYQSRGLDWLWFCTQTGLGACLADDMGLGKTVQVLATLLRKQEVLPDSPPSLLVVPASLIGNWKREAAAFAPTLRLHIAHRSDGAVEAADLTATDLVVTTYGMLPRLDWLVTTDWSWVVLDEAQAIKNHGSRQSKAVRKLRARARIALTGTPIENHLGDLWSLFDFINPGLLGTSAQFKSFVKTLQTGTTDHYAPLRRLVAPYILRRLKTDRSIISDLPDKTEMKVFCGLTPAQARLYQRTATDLAETLETATGIERRGLVLGYLMRFKQICNHPDQLTKTNAFDPTHSAKFQRLAELCDEMASRGEKALVFTQFRELTEPLAAHLATVFRRRGLVLHGGTAVKERQHLVERFQREDGPPFFVLSLKAGGTGLNLTAASHVIHFDRWWNPAVEIQATDRAFRIGQQRNVFVHKFITTGTLEEKIDALLTAKQNTADSILTAGAEKALTEMNNAELLDFIRLDLTQSTPAPDQ